MNSNLVRFTTFRNGGQEEFAVPANTIFLVMHKKASDDPLITTGPTTVSALLPHTTLGPDGKVTTTHNVTTTEVCESFDWIIDTVNNNNGKL